MSLAKVIHVTIINAIIITPNLIKVQGQDVFFFLFFFHPSNISRLLWSSSAFLWFKWDHLDLQNLPKYKQISPQSVKHMLQLVPQILILYGDSYVLI